MGAIFSLLFPLYVLFAIVLVVGVAAKTKSVKATLFNLFMVVIIPGHDIVSTHILAAYYCISDPNPKTFIKKTVEYPESIYWEDNIYPGFNEEDRKLMIKNYLDGKYVKTIALNGDDGKVYVYSATPEDYTSFKFDKTYRDRPTQYAEIIFQRGQVYEKSEMPQINYSVVSNEVQLASFSAKFLYSDEVSVTDNRSGELIGYNWRFMRFYYNAFPDLNVGSRYYYPYDAVCGELKNIDSWVFEFVDQTPDGKVALSKKVRGSRQHLQSINNKLYNKYLKGK